MENQKIINLLDKIDTDSKHFATKKWYVINDENNTNYGVDKNTGANNPDTIKYKQHYKLVAVDLSIQKELDADPRAIQQLEFK